MLVLHLPLFIVPICCTIIVYIIVPFNSVCIIATSYNFLLYSDCPATSDICIGFFCINLNTAKVALMMISTILTIITITTIVIIITAITTIIISIIMARLTYCATRVRRRLVSRATVVSSMEPKSLSSSISSLPSLPPLPSSSSSLASPSSS